MIGIPSETPQPAENCLSETPAIAQSLTRFRRTSTPFVQKQWELIFQDSQVT